MFPWNNSDEMSFHVSSQQQNTIPQDLIFTARAIDSVDSTVHTTDNINFGQGCQGTQLLETINLIHDDDNINNQNRNINTNNNKKIMHREIEKQRRKEMASLNSELRSLIPLEYIKGKRSISDHMDTATNYIKYLKVKISKLSVRRDDLIKESNYFGANNVGSSSASDQFGVSSCVAVNHCLVGVEIVLSSTSYDSSTNGHVLPLSTVLQLLLGKGLVLFSCVTTKVSEKLLMNTIQAEVGDEICINLAELKQALNDTISMQK